MEVKAWYSGWHEVTKEQAIRFVNTMRRGSTLNIEEFIKNMYDKHLRGITVEELLND